jgi:hypothetical protein
MQEREYEPGNERPEVERSEPDPMMETQAAEDMRARREAVPPMTTEGQGAWPGMGDYQQRFEALQAEFIEQPRAAVEKAETLIEEAVDRMMTSLRERVRSVHSEIGDGDDTERLRLAMRSYRDLIESIGERQG